MGWPAPQEQRSAVRNAGRRIRKGSATQEDIDILNRWRAAHGYLINTFQARFRGRTKGSNIPVVQRLKRAATIIDKLQQGRALDLSTMQDIAGVRLVFADIAQLREYRTRFHDTRAQHELTHEPDRYDYIASPKVSGYRGVHDIYRYQAGSESGSKWNNLLIEVQYRTLVQHAWATAVELSDALTRNRTKFGQGDNRSQRFFQICSELLSRQHEASTSCLPSASMEELYLEWTSIEDECHFFDQLKRVGQQEGAAALGGFVILVMQPDGALSVESLRSYRAALQRLLNLEAEHPDWDVVLVSGEEESLRSAFRNYFQNASEFVQLMNEAIGRS